MHSNSPYISSAASPPGPPSSQSSSVGSCYSSEFSSQASLRARPTLSDPSSSSTSPASVYERSADQPYASAPFKHSTASSAQSARQSSSGHYAPAESQFLSTHTGSASQSPFVSRSSPRGAMQPPMSGALEAEASHLYHRTGPSNSANEYASHTSRGSQHSASPDNHRGPLPKARRTSPGGSRASGNLDASQGSAQYSYASSSDPHSSASRSASTSTGADADSQMSSGSTITQHTGVNAGPFATSRPSDASAGSHPRWPPSDANPSQRTSPSRASSSTMLSPRSRGDDGHVAPSSGKTPSPRNALATSQASSGPLTAPNDGLSRSKPPTVPKMDLATFAPQELLKILANLLHEIATANDEFQPDGSSSSSSSRRAARSRDRSAPATPAESAPSSHSTVDGSAMRDYSAPPGSQLSFTDSRRPSVTTAALGALATPSSTLCFHARNVPSISIESYLLRILKYCPTTNEVFLSLLVYFDRMSRMGTGAKPGANGEGEVAGEAAGLPRAVERATGQQQDLGGSDASARLSDGGSSSLSTKEQQPYTHPGIRGFAIDSYNVHRLVIAGVTVASKFFSDVFYTNSRYAKVGGLPPHELNQLELQFLLLNDFRLTIPLEEMQRYADQLLMYASGRPDMAKLTKQVSPAGTPSIPVPAPSSTTAASGDGTGSTHTAVKADHEASTASNTASGALQAASSHGAGTGRPEADAEGDVQMADAQG